MKTYRGFLGLGSNIGERQKFLSASIAKLKDVEGVEVIWSSSVYETEPYGKKDQQKFLNAVVEIQTRLTPRELLHHVKTIEDRMGRKSVEKWGPREIDIDILLYDGLVHEDELLKVPHPEMEKRKFVLVPFREIAPEVVHPINGQTIEEMAIACKDSSKVVKTFYKIIV